MLASMILRKNASLRSFSPQKNTMSSKLVKSYKNSHVVIILVRTQYAFSIMAKNNILLKLPIQVLINHAILFLLKINKINNSMEWITRAVSNIFFVNGNNIYQNLSRY